MDRRLETFLAVCQTMNYRRAAEALHLTQPAVTKQIQSLEASYGVRLFSYDGRKLRKTAPGSALEVFAISQRYQEQELERALHAAPRKILRVGATKTIGDYILPPAICSFVRAPEHELQFTVDNTTRLLGQLEAGSWILWSWRAFSTSAAMTASCCGRSRISASARPGTALPDGASRRRSC